MKKNPITSLALGAAALGLLLLAGSASADGDLARNEGLVCTACHDKPGSKLLTDRGKYFELMRSMDGYDDLEASFGSCTFCHRRKPGSKKLTRAGKGFANALGGMEELVEWVQKSHPGWPETAEERDDAGDDAEAGSADEGATPPALPAH